MAPAAGAEVIALRSPAMCRFFARVMQRQMRGAFHRVRLARPGLPDVPPDRPLIVYSNHPSWWDPAFFMVLATLLFPGREGYGPIDARMLEKYRFMRRIGIFGVDLGSRAGAAAFLRTAEAILAEPSRMLWVTAQGHFADPRTRPVELRGGVARVAARVPSAVAVPLAVEYPFWTEKQPEALARFGDPVEPAAAPEAFEGALEATMDRLARDAMARDPARFTPLLTGRSGVGGVYDLWRGGAAALQGRRFRPEHEVEENT